MSTHLSQPECVPARILNEFAYCQRLAYIEWVQGDFAHNPDTLDGTLRHRSVSREEGAVPAELQPGQSIHARSLWLSAPEEHLSARIDLLEGDGSRVTPVDYKRGSVPENPERSWEPERVQLCAQGLVLRANGFSCDSGIIYYASSKTRIPIVFDEALIERTRSLVQQLRSIALAGRIPPPLVDSPKCPRCSLAGICLPDETNLLANGIPSPEPEREDIRRLLAARDNALPLYVQEQGARIALSGELLQVYLKKEKLGEARLFETSQISLFGNIQITTQALCEAIQRNIPVAFFTRGGWFQGLAHGMSHKNIELRCAQYRAAFDPATSLILARQFVAAKIENCRTLLMRNHPEPPLQTIRELATLAAQASQAKAMDTLLGLEGIAAKRYFNSFAGMLKPRHESSSQSNPWTFNFEGRNRRPPRDPINALLSFTYALLAKDLAVTCLTIGFDPFLAFYHQPRYGRPALALDLMEEFRPIIADSVVLSAVNNGVVSPNDFICRGPAAALSATARKKFIHAYERRLDTLVTHPIFGYRISYRRILEVQARLLGRVLLGELAQYPAFTTR